MTTFNTASQAFGHVPAVDDKPAPEASAADKAGGTMTLTGDGVGFKARSKGPQTFDVRAEQLKQVEASVEVSRAPLQLRTRSGSAGTAMQAEANPQNFLLAIRGRETSLQAALQCGWVVRGSDGNFYDTRTGGPAPLGKPEGDVKSPEDKPSEETSQEQPEADPEATLPEGFELSETQQQLMGVLGDIANKTPDAVNYAFKHAAEDGDVNAEGFKKVLSEQTGMDRELVEGLVAAAVETYTSVADAAVAEVSNVEPQLVYDWLRDKQPAMAAKVILDAQAGRFGSVREATDMYLSNLASIDPEAALDADLGPHAKAERVNGSIAVRIGGKLYSWSEAMRFREGTVRKTSKANALTIRK